MYYTSCCCNVKLFLNGQNSLCHSLTLDMCLKYCIEQYLKLNKFTFFKIFWSTLLTQVCFYALTITKKSINNASNKGIFLIMMRPRTTLLIISCQGQHKNTLEYFVQDRVLQIKYIFIARENRMTSSKNMSFNCDRNVASPDEQNVTLFKHNQVVNYCHVPHKSCWWKTHVKKTCLVINKCIKFI